MHNAKVVLAGSAAFSLALVGIYALLGSAWSAALPSVFRDGPLVLLPLLLAALTLTDGLGEEPAWRGFALPRLLDRHDA